MAGVWTRRGWALVRGLLCWIGVAILGLVGFLGPLIAVGWGVRSAMYPGWGSSSNYDENKDLIALVVAVPLALLAGAIGVAISSIPAFALLAKSGLFNPLRERRRRRDEAGLL